MIIRKKKEEEKKSRRIRKSFLGTCLFPDMTLEAILIR